MFATRFWFLIKKSSLKLRKHKERNHVIYFIEKWVKILTHIKILIKLYLIFKFKIATPPKVIQHSEFLELFEMLFREITSLNICNFNKECVKSKLQDSAYSSFKQVCKISDKNPSQRGG